MKNYHKNARIKNMPFVFMFDHFKMGEQKQMCIWLNFNLNLEFEFAIQLQYTSIKMNLPQTSTLYIMVNLSCVCAFYFNVVPPFVDDCAGNRLSETVVTPEEEEKQDR